MDFKKLIRKRRSIKRFILGRSPDWRDIIDAIDNVRFIPAAGNLFNLKFILVSNKDIISQIADACQQPFIKQANYVVVCVSEPEALTRLYGDTGLKFTHQQAGAAIENFLLGLTERGLATTWIGYYYEEMIKSLLDIPEKMIIEALFPIGLEAKNNISKTKRKTDLDNVIFFEKFGNPYMRKISRFPADNVA